ncbi:unnamed protein product [Moneuplotes crassus]|uniref:6-phosphofructo-2-kinase n=1 Tax=Euplotes crassus TaxID=5936 RepID=A0AAD1URV3_EUPCR|nr:unnamed protein product [Moneuplotes crassus]
MECNKQIDLISSEEKFNETTPHQIGKDSQDPSFEEVLDLISQMTTHQSPNEEEIYLKIEEPIALDSKQEASLQSSPEDFIIKDKFLLTDLNSNSANSESTEGSEGSPKKLPSRAPQKTLLSHAAMKKLSHRLSLMLQNSDLEKIDEEVINSLKSLKQNEVYSTTIYFSRHGQSIYNTKELIGGDSLLSAKGKKYAEGLRKFFQESQEKFDDLQKYCSTLKRTQQTIGYLSEVGAGEPIIRPEIDEINAGICDSMTYEQIEEKFPEEFKLRKKDKLNYRYPEGESYIDLKARLKPFLEEIEESQTPVLVISHQATLRCAYDHMKGLKTEEIPYIQVPLHSLVKFERSIFGYRETIYKYDTEKGTFGKEVHKVNFLDSFLEQIEAISPSKSAGLHIRMPDLIQT